jgi:hypothetical protein
MGENCTFLGVVLWAVLSTIGVSIACVVNFIWWTAAAIIGFFAMTLARIFVNFEYVDNVAGMCLWWLDHVQEGFEV